MEDNYPSESELKSEHVNVKNRLKMIILNFNRISDDVFDKNACVGYIHG